MAATEWLGRAGVAGALTRAGAASALSRAGVAGALAAGLVATGTALAQLLVAPQIALADNGDYLRLTCRLDVVADVPSGAPTFFSHAILGWRPAMVEPCFAMRSSQLPLLEIAQWLTPGAGRLDLRVVGAMHAVLIGCCVVALLLALPGRRLGRLVLAVAVLAVLVDGSRTLYLASAYSEPASLLGLLLLLAAASAAWRWLPARSGAVVITIAAVPLVLSKPQHAPLAVVVAAAVALWVVGERSRTPGKVAALAVSAVCGAGLVLAAGSYIKDVPAELTRPNIYNSVFYEVLRFSPNPVADAKALDIDPRLIRYAGTFYWETPGVTGSEFSEFFATTGPTKIVRFYAVHPARSGALYARAARASFHWLPNYLGTFTVSADRPDYAQTCRACPASRLAAAAAPGAPVLLAMLWTGAAAAAVTLLLRRSSRDDRALAGLVLLLDAVAVTGFATAVLGSGDYELVKHLFLVGVADALLLVLAGAAAVRVAAGSRHPRSTQPAT